MPCLSRLARGVHPHQPVGSLHPVFTRHLAEGCRPRLERMGERGALPVETQIALRT